MDTKVQGRPGSVVGEPVIPRKIPVLLAAVAFLVNVALLVVPLMASDPADFLPKKAEMAPLSPAGEEERYTSDTLWEKINGQADIYVRYGLLSAVSVLFEDPSDPSRTVEISIFTFDYPLAAFGIFSSLRSPGAGLKKIGNGGMVGDYQALFWQGPHFVLVDAFGSDKTRSNDLEKAVSATTARLGSPPSRPPLLETFEMLAVPDTVRFLPDHLLGRDFLPPGLEGIEDSGLTVFVAVSPTSGEQVLESYQEVLKRPRRFSWGSVIAVAGTDPEVGPVMIAVQQDRLAGVRGQFDPPEVRELLSRLLSAAVR